MTGFSIGFLDSGNSMGADKVKIIINTFPDININWLIMDKGDMIKNEEEKTSNNALTNELIKTKDEVILLQAKQILLLEEKLKELKK